MNVPHLSALEHAVIAAILQSLPKAEKCLTEQLRQSELQSRDHNGYGFFTSLALSESAPVCLEGNGTHSASALVDGELCGFLLWVRDGKIDFLEGYPLCGDAWPQHEIFETITPNMSETERKS